MTTSPQLPTPEAASAIVAAVLDGLAPLRVDLVPPPSPPAAGDARAEEAAP